jgi:hypothetical protein
MARKPELRCKSCGTKLDPTWCVVIDNKLVCPKCKELNPRPLEEKVPKKKIHWTTKVLLFFAAMSAFFGFLYLQAAYTSMSPVMPYLPEVAEREISKAWNVAYTLWGIAFLLFIAAVLTAYHYGKSKIEEQHD